MNSLHDAWTVDQETPQLAPSAHKHRHWIIAPIFLFVAVSLMVTASTSSERADLLPTTNTASANIRMLQDGTQFLPDRDASVSLKGSVLTLNDGSMLVNALGESHVTLESGSTLLGWNGGYAIHRSHDMLTIAAISTPVLVHIGQTPLFVPSGMQWTIKMKTVSGSDVLGFMKTSLPMILPSDYRSAQRSKLENFPVFVPEAPTAIDPTVVQVLKGMAPVLDTAEQQRDVFVQHLRILTASGDVLSVTNALRDADPSVFASAKGQQDLAQLLALSINTPALSSPYLALVTDSDLSLLLAYHPSLRSQAFLLTQTETLPLAMRTAFLFLYPYVDTLPDPVPSLVHNRWQQADAQALDDEKDSLSALTVQLRIFASVSLQLRNNQFQDRLTQLVAATHDLSKEWEKLLTDEQKTLITSIEQAEVPAAIQLASSSSSVTSEAAQPLSPDQSTALLGQVQALLMQQGAMFTHDTSVAPQSASAVQIESVVFATGAGDQVFSFLFDPLTSTLSHIVRDGDRQTNAVTLDQFIEWIKH